MIEFRDSIQPNKGNYDAKYCIKLLNHMRTGKTFNSFAGSIGFSPSTITKWREKHDEFREAFEIGESLNMAKWEDIAIDQATGETKGNSATTTFMMKNIHSGSYMDKQILETDTKITYLIETGVPSIPELPIEVESRVIEDNTDLL